MKTKSYFPILIRFSDSTENQVFNSPHEIPSGRAFKVIETNFSGVAQKTS